MNLTHSRRYEYVALEQQPFFDGPERGAVSFVPPKAGQTDGRFNKRGNRPNGRTRTRAVRCVDLELMGRFLLKTEGDHEIRRFWDDRTRSLPIEEDSPGTRRACDNANSESILLYTDRLGGLSTQKTGVTSERKQSCRSRRIEFSLGCGISQVLLRNGSEGTVTTQVFPNSGRSPKFSLSFRGITAHSSQLAPQPMDVATPTDVCRSDRADEVIECSTRGFWVIKAKRQRCGLESPFGAQVMVTSFCDDRLHFPDHRRSCAKPSRGSLQPGPNKAQFSMWPRRNSVITKAELGLSRQ